MSSPSGRGSANFLIRRRQLRRVNGMTSTAVAEPATRALEDFIRALRACEVRVSPAEAIDAHRACAEVGFSDRALLKDALAVTLAKSIDEVAHFDACFEAFFARREF